MNQMSQMGQMNQINRNQMSSSRRSCSSGNRCSDTCDTSSSRSSANIPSRDSSSCTQYNFLEKMSHAQLMNYINEISFAVIDSTLYLDTHPHDSNALAYNREMVSKRTAALEVHARRFGPLTIDSTTAVNNGCWEWIMQPWPWEIMSKGGCR